VEPALDIPGQTGKARVVSLVLDTNILVDYVRRVPSAIAWLRALPEPPQISVVSLLELYVGARSQREERDIEAMCAPLKGLPVTAEIAERGGGFMRHFGKTHRIDIPDAIIAATAEHHGLRLATLNVKHFPMFPKLKRPY
jgi:predicted nucleic acid-binding protein